MRGVTREFSIHDNWVWLWPGARCWVSITFNEVLIDLLLTPLGKRIAASECRDRGITGRSEAARVRRLAEEIVHSDLAGVLRLVLPH